VTITWFFACSRRGGKLASNASRWQPSMPWRRHGIDVCNVASGCAGGEPIHAAEPEVVPDSLARNLPALGCPLSTMQF
jgi:hypothetical protein